MSGAVRLVDLCKTFGEVVAVDDIDLEVADGEFFSLLGPSGCGKTTTLRLIAGFERPDSGAIVIDGVDQASVPPHRRPVNTVFQSYALFPHLTVEQNVGFGLRYHHVDKTEARHKISSALELVQLGGMEKRKPTQLSGGQQQRVALARSLVLNPSVLLLDEPLGALDAKLRKSLQLELKTLQREVGITFIYVTHDQEEALTMSDRIAVMSNGRVEQLGTPAEVYEAPSSSYIAEFLGVSNLMEAEVLSVGSDGTRIRLGGHSLTASVVFEHTGAAMVAIRPERIQILNGDATEGGNVVSATIDRLVYAGPVINVLARVDGLPEIQVSVPNQGSIARLVEGETIRLRFPEDSLRVLEKRPEALPIEQPGAAAG